MFGKYLRIAAPALALALTSVAVWAVQSPSVELGKSGAYDGAVTIERDDEGRMVFTDVEITEGVTLDDLRYSGVEHGLLLGLGGDDHPQYILHTALDCEAELEAKLDDIDNVFTDADGALDDDDLSDDTTDDLAEGMGNLYFSEARVGAVAVEAMSTSAEAGTAPLSDGAGTLTMTDVATQAELDAHDHDDDYVNADGDTINGDITIYGGLNVSGESTYLDNFNCMGAVSADFLSAAGGGGYARGGNLMLGGILTDTSKDNTISSTNTDGDINIVADGSGALTVTADNVSLDASGALTAGGAVTGTTLSASATSGTALEVGGDDLAVVDGAPVVGSFSATAATLKLHTASGYNSIIEMREDSVNTGMTIKYDGLENTGQILMYPTSTPVTAITIEHSYGHVALGTQAPDTRLDVNGALTLREKSDDPSNPDEGSCAIWMSDGTGTGDNGDIMISITAGGATKTATLIDFSEQ